MDFYGIRSSEVLGLVRISQPDQRPSLATNASANGVGSKERGSGWLVGYPETTRTIPYLITLCALSISTVFSIGRASIVCPLPVIVVALNIEL